jgi:hypothetical protein
LMAPKALGPLLHVLHTLERLWHRLYCVLAQRTTVQEAYNVSDWDRGPRRWPAVRRSKFVQECPKLDTMVL